MAQTKPEKPLKTPRKPRDYKPEDYKDLPKGKPRKAKRPYNKLTHSVIAKIIAKMLGDFDSTDSDIAREFNIAPSAVCQIRKQLPEDLQEKLKVKEESHLGEKVEQLLSITLDSLMNISRVTQDEGWLKSQNASALGVFFGIKADRTIKILEAMERANAARAESERNLPKQLN